MNCVEKVTLQIKNIIEKLEKVKKPAEYVGLDTAVIDEAIETILQLNLQCEHLQSEEIILRDEKKYLSECYDAERKRVAAAKQKMINLSRELQEVKSEYNKALSTLSAHGIRIGDLV